MIRSSDMAELIDRQSRRIELQDLAIESLEKRVLLERRIAREAIKGWRERFIILSILAWVLAVCAIAAAVQPWMN